jgi:ElaB/YqjD/DUF883 family membrane-anchored ribosome-binding protein
VEPAFRADVFPVLRQRQCPRWREVGDMTERPGDAAEIGRRAAEEAFDGARRSARYFGEQLRATAHSVLKEQQDRMADAVRSFADALRRAADQLERDENRAVAHYADQAAAQVDRLSATVRNGDVADLVAGAEDFARRQPSLFIAGAVAAGFAIGRLLVRPPAPPSPALADGGHASQEIEAPAEALASEAELR